MVNLDPTAPINPDLVTQGIEFYKTLPGLVHGLYFDHLVMHWQVGTLEQTSEEYNAETYLDDASNSWRFKITHNPLENAVEIVPGVGTYAEHTYHRNSHGFGAAVAAMAGATPSNFGPYALQGHELEAFFAMCGAICVKYNLDPVDSTQVYTHAEAAIQDNYFPGDGDPDARWDFERVNASNDPLTVEEAYLTAGKMRKRVALYKTAIKEKTGGA